MLFDGYLVSVVADGKALPEIQHNNKTIIVAKPGSEFTVLVTRPAHQHGAAQHILMDMTVDGLNVGYSRILSPGSQTPFEGYAAPGPADTFRYNAFKFAAATPVADAPDAPAQVITSLDQIKHGKIVMKLYKAMPTNKQGRSYMAGADKASGPSAKLPEGKKWFLAPSLTTQAGAAKTSSSGWSKVVYDRVGPAFLELELHYETASTLLLRKVLDADKPEHRAILQEYGDETARALLQPEPAARASAPASAPAAARAAAQQQRGAAPAESMVSAAGPGGPAGRKRGAGASSSAAAAGASVQVKEEGPAGSKRPRQQQQQQRPSGPPIVVDLTGPTMMPATRVAGREVQRNEVALCYLTGEVPGTSARAWKVEKVEVVEL